MNYSSETILLI